MLGKLRLSSLNKIRVLNKEKIRLGIRRLANINSFGICCTYKTIPAFSDKNTPKSSFHFGSTLLQSNSRAFSTQSSQSEEVIDVDEGERPVILHSERKEFKAETRKLLDIVAKSIYTDKEVFLRELLSNCSDALEKQRYKEMAGEATPSAEPLYINITANEKDRTITIFDSGIGMNKEELIENLGTIAHSGSQDFSNKIQNSDSPSSSSDIIGQFGVGFYSTFIVADSVEVYSKPEGASSGCRWVSDGSGDYEISQVENLNFTRGTKLILHLKANSREFAKEKELDNIIKKYSLFISYPIKLNGDLVNNLAAIWYRSKVDVTGEEYERFYGHISNSKIPYKFKLHYHTDVPISIKSILYVPSTNTEKMGMTQEALQVNLYSRKVLIKENCTELLPNYLRFIKGVVDCEDLPLNISRENYQDSNLVLRLKNVLTRRVLKLLEEELKTDVERYTKWYEDFHQFLKEGLVTDQDNSETLLKLTRFRANFCDVSISLEDYVKKMTKDQGKIYYMFAPKRDLALSSPYLEPFQNTDVPVLFTEHHVDEMCFRNVNTYKGFKFVSIESNFEEISKDVQKGVEVEANGLPQSDITPFCLWLKNELGSNVSKVAVSKRLTGSPAIIVGQVSSSMRQVMMMMDPQNQQQQSQGDQTMEVNPNHEIIVNLNQIRKKDPQFASLLSRILLDNVFTQAGIPFQISDGVSRNFELMSKTMKMFRSSPVLETPVAHREKKTSPALKEAEKVLGEEKKQFDAEIRMNEKGEPEVTKK